MQLETSPLNTAETTVGVHHAESINEKRHMERIRFRLFLHPSSSPRYICKDIECKFMMGVTHVHLWPKEAVSNKEAIESS